MNNTKCSERFEVSVGLHSTLCAEGYTQFYDRLRKKDKGELPEGEEVYGLQQAIEHVAEYYGTDDEYKESRQKEKLTIVKVITVVVDVPFVPIEPIRIVGNRSHHTRRRLTIEDEQKEFDALNNQEG